LKKWKNHHHYDSKRQNQSNLSSLSSCSVLRQEIKVQAAENIFNKNKMFSKDYYVYILASKRNGTLYIEVTNDIIRRVQEHKEGIIEGFTKKYRVHIWFIYEIYGDIGDAIYREKQLKE